MHASKSRRLAANRILVAATLVLSFLPRPSDAAVNTLVSAGAAITNAIAINKRSDLDFGSIVVSDVSFGTVSLTPSGTRNSSGDVGFGNGVPVTASFSVSRLSRNDAHFSVALPSSVVVSNAQASMIVDQFQHSALDDLSRTSGALLMVGATLNLTVHQAPGYYIGTFTVTVDEH